MSEIVATYDLGDVHISLPRIYVEDARPKINMAICGHEHCNVYSKDENGVPSKIVSAPWVTDEMEAKLQEAHWRLTAGHVVPMRVKITDEGEFIFEIKKKRKSRKRERNV